MGDLVAGVTVGLTVIPQALAYAGIAGLDPAVSMDFMNLLHVRTLFIISNHKMNFSTTSKIISQNPPFSLTVWIIWIVHGLFCVHNPGLM